MNASFTREVCNNDEVIEVMHNWLGRCMTFKVVINLTGDEVFNTTRARDILE